MKIFSSSTLELAASFVSMSSLFFAMVINSEMIQSTSKKEFSLFLSVNRSIEKSRKPLAFIFRFEELNGKATLTNQGQFLNLFLDWFAFCWCLIFVTPQSVFIQQLMSFPLISGRLSAPHPPLRILRAEAAIISDWRQGFELFLLSCSLFKIVQQHSCTIENKKDIYFEKLIIKKGYFQSTNFDEKYQTNLLFPNFTWFMQQLIMKYQS